MDVNRSSSDVQDTPPLSVSSSEQPSSLSPAGNVNVPANDEPLSMDTSPISESEDPLEGISSRKTKTEEPCAVGAKGGGADDRLSTSKVASEAPSIFAIAAVDGSDGLRCSSNEPPSIIAIAAVDSPDKRKNHSDSPPSILAIAAVDSSDNKRGYGNVVGKSETAHSSPTDPSAAVGKEMESSPTTIEDSCPSVEDSEETLARQEPGRAPDSKEVGKDDESSPATRGEDSGKMEQSSHEMVDEHRHPISTDQKVTKVSTPAPGEGGVSDGSTPPLPPPSVPQTPTHVQPASTGSAVLSPRATPVGILKHTSQFDTPSSASKVSQMGQGLFRCSSSEYNVQYVN